MHALDTGAVVSILLNAPECSIGDCIIGLKMRDMKFSCRRLGDEVMGVNLLQEIPELSVPVVFFAGSYDYTTPFVLVEQFYASLHAPYKKLIWFEQLGPHAPYGGTGKVSTRTHCYRRRVLLRKAATQNAQRDGTRG